MAHRIVFAHSKGGTGKTTTCVNVAGFLQKAGKRVLVVDGDPDANATMNLGLHPERLDLTLHNMLMAATGISADVLHQCIYPTSHGIDVVAGGPSLHDTYNLLWERDGRHEALDRALDRIDDWYDYILIDVPSTQLNAIAGGIRAADAFYLVMDHSVFSRDGAGVLRQFLKRLPDRHSLTVNPDKVFLVEHRQANPLRTLVNKFLLLDHLPRSERIARSQFGTRLSTIPFIDDVVHSQERGTPLSHLEDVPKAADAFREIADDIMAYTA